MATTRVNISLDSDNVEWFNETYKGASLSWWINLLLQKSKEVMTTTPEDFARIAAEALKEELHS